MRGKAFNPEKFAERLRELMSDAGDTIYSLAESVQVSPSSISKYTNSAMAPRIPVIDTIARKYKVNPVWLMGADVEKYLEDGNLPEPRKIPVVGTIAAGLPILAQENIIAYDYVYDDQDITFALRVKGDSMIGARLQEGDSVYIHKQDDVDNGDIAAVLIDDEAVIKRIYKYNGMVVLKSENPAYKDIIINKSDRKDVKILGKAVSFKGGL